MSEEHLSGKSILAELAEIEARERRAYDDKTLEAIAQLSVIIGATVMPKSDMLTRGKPILLLSEAMYEKLIAKYGKRTGLPT